MDIESLKINLADVGCNSSESEQIFQMCAGGNIKDALQMLKKYRCRLMDELHENGRKVDCLDFLIRRTTMEMKQADEQNGGI